MIYPLIIEIITSLDRTTLILQILTGIIVIVLGIIIDHFFINKSIDKFGERAKLDIHHLKPLKRVASIALSVFILFIILGIFGLQEYLLGAFAVAGFAGIVIGLAVRDVVSDLLTGALLYIYQPFKIGDSVVIGDIDGKVVDIGAGGVKIRAWSGELVIIPNSKMRTSIVQNFSIDTRRATITFNVDYSSDFSKTLEACKRILNDIPETLKNPEPAIRVDDFTEKSVKILILVWFSIDDYWVGYTKVQKGLADAFREMGLNPPIIRTEENIRKK
ncbi:mechanosensitive ion channel family protein [[Eubacterium] cellulosolvens]